MHEQGDDKRRRAHCMIDWNAMEKTIAELIEADHIKSHVIDVLYSIVLQLGGADVLERELHEEMQEAAILSKDYE